MEKEQIVDQMIKEVKKDLYRKWIRSSYACWRRHG